MIHNRLMTVKEVTEWCRISRATLMRWLRTGRGPAYVRLGRRILFRRDDVERWLVRHAMLTDDDIVELIEAMEDGERERR